MKCMSYYLHMIVLKNVYGFLRFYRLYKKCVTKSPFTILWNGKSFFFSEFSGGSFWKDLFMDSLGVITRRKFISDSTTRQQFHVNLWRVFLLTKWPLYCIATWFSMSRLEKLNTISYTHTCSVLNTGLSNDSKIASF